MKTTAFAIALLMGSAAIAQTTGTSMTSSDVGAGSNPDLTTTNDTSPNGSTTNMGLDAQTGTTSDTGLTSQTDTSTGTSTGADTLGTGTNMSTGTNTGTSTDSWSNTGQTGATSQSGMTGQSGTAMASNMNAGGSQVVQPGNSDPEKDARGISVISAEAFVPAGYNGIAGTGMGGPAADSGQGSDSYPACSRTVTDNCTQTYERGRSRT